MISMDTKKVHVQVRAVYSAGVLKLIDDLELPEGTQVRVSIQPLEASEDLDVKLTYPTHLVPADRLDELTGLVEAGGDALRDSEAL